MFHMILTFVTKTIQNILVFKLDEVGPVDNRPEVSGYKQKPPVWLGIALFRAKPGLPAFVRDTDPLTETQIQSSCTTTILHFV